MYLELLLILEFFLFFLLKNITAAIIINNRMQITITVIRTPIIIRYTLEVESINDSANCECINVHNIRNNIKFISSA